MRAFKFFHGFVGPRRIVVNWEPELTNDLNNAYAIDAEAELTRLLTEQIVAEWDEEVIRTITRNWNGGQRA